MFDWAGSDLTYTVANTRMKCHESKSPSRHLVGLTRDWRALRVGRRRNNTGTSDDFTVVKLRGTGEVISDHCDGRGVLRRDKATST